MRAAAVVLAAAAVTAPEAPAARWTPPTRIGSESLSYDMPFAATNARGDVGVSWGSDRGAQFAVARRGRAFGSPMLVPHSAGAFDVLIGLGPRREVALAWDHEYEFDVGDRAPLEYWDVFAALTRPGRAITRPAKLTRHGQDSFVHDVAVGPNGQAATWLSTVLGRHFVSFAPAGENWDKRRRTPGDVMGVRFLRRGRADVYLFGKRRIRSMRRSAAGRFARPTTIGTHDGWVRAHGNDRHGLAVVMVDRHSGGPHRLVALMRSGGRLRRVQVLDRSPDPQTEYTWVPPVAVAPSGRAVVAWQPLSGVLGNTCTKIVVATRAPGGRFGQPVRVGPEPRCRGVRELRTAIAPDGTAVVAWRANRGNAHYSIYASVARDGVHFERSKPISGEVDSEISEPSVVVPRGGRALVTWLRGTDVEATRLLPPGD